MSDVIKKNTKTLSLKNPSSTSLTKIIKDSLDIDINNLKGSDIPKIFKKGLKFKGTIGKKIIDSVSDYFKKNPNTIKRYEKSLPDTLKKRINKLPVSTTPKKIKKIDIANIMKNPRTGRGQNLPTRITDKNKKTGTNITKRVLEGEVLQGIKKPKNDSKVNQQTIQGQFKRLTPKAIRNQMKNPRTGRGQDKLNITGLKRKGFLAVDKDFPKITPKEAPAKEIEKKVKPPKDFSPKIKKSPTPSVKREDLPKTKSNDYTGRFIDKEGNVAYDSFSDFLAHMTGKPKKRAMPKKTARIIGTGNKLKRKEADTKGAGKGVKFKAFKSGTKDKTISQKQLDKNAKYKASKAYQLKNMEAPSLMDIVKNPIKSIKKSASNVTKARKRAKQVAAGDPIAERKYGTGKRTGDIMSYMYPEGVLKFKPDGSVEKPLKSYKRNPKSKNKSGFEVTKKSGGGLIAGLYDKSEKSQKYKGNTSSARQVKGFGKARKG